MTTTNSKSWITWYALDYKGEVLKQGDTKDKVLSNYAHYYIEYFSGKYAIFDKEFNPTYLVHNNIVVLHKEVKGSPFNATTQQQTLKFFLTFRSGDSSNNTTSKEFKGGIGAFKKCIDFMDEIGKFWTKKEWKLTQRVNYLEDEVKKNRS